MKTMTEKRKSALFYLLLSIICGILAPLSTIRLKHDVHSIPPITSKLLMPNLLMIMAYVFFFFFMVAVIIWIVKGDK